MLYWIKNQHSRAAPGTKGDVYKRQPWTYHDENDNLVGYDGEVATEIAKKLGVEPQFVEGEWDGLLAGLDAGRYDIMVNGVDITPERAEKYDFSTPYAFNRCV